MPFIAPELIIQAKQMDLLTYLKNYEPYELVKFSGNTYCTRTHDSLKISNGKWIWWSRGIGGRSALDYLIKVKGYSFLEAVETIIGYTAIQAPVYEKPQPKEENKPLLLPEKCASNRVITEYLFGRGSLTTFSIANDIAKYFAIIPAMFTMVLPQMQILNIMHLSTPASAILSALIFNAIIIPGLIPIAMKGVKYRPMKAEKMLLRNMGIYGLGGIVVPFVGIKLIDLLL